MDFCSDVALFWLYQKNRENLNVFALGDGLSNISFIASLGTMDSVHVHQFSDGKALLMGN